MSSKSSKIGERPNVWVTGFYIEVPIIDRKVSYIGVVRKSVLNRLMNLVFDDSYKSSGVFGITVGDVNDSAYLLIDYSVIGCFSSYYGVLTIWDGDWKGVITLIASASGRLAILVFGIANGVLLQEYIGLATVGLAIIDYYGVVYFLLGGVGAVYYFPYLLADLIYLLIYY